MCMESNNKIMKALSEKRFVMEVYIEPIIKFITNCSIYYTGFKPQVTLKSPTWDFTSFRNVHTEQYRVCKKYIEQFQGSNAQTAAFHRHSSEG